MNDLFADPPHACAVDKKIMHPSGRLYLADPAPLNLTDASNSMPGTPGLLGEQHVVGIGLKPELPGSNSSSQNIVACEDIAARPASRNAMSVVRVILSSVSIALSDPSAWPAA